VTASRRVNGSWQTTTLHIDGRARAACLSYPHRTPILEIGAGNSIIKLTLHASHIDQATVTFARELAEQAHTFAREVERLHHTHPAPPQENTL
jgi:tRNA1(Val) A37 N6-methylase TrmN6